jgi:hypothetical protein
VALLRFLIQKWYNIADNSGGVCMLKSDPPNDKYEFRYFEPLGHNSYFLGDLEGKNAEPPPS